MAVSRLNVDILANVCEFLTEISDVLSVSLTCSSAHVVAIRWLLLTCAVKLKSGPSIQRFHSFLFADEPARAPHVRTVHIELLGPQPEADDSSLLLNVLTSCRNVEHITVTYRNASLSTAVDPPFWRAITAIDSLRSFTVRSDSIDALTLLLQSRKPVFKLGIHSNNTHTTFRYAAVLQQLLPRIIVETLEEFELDQFTVDPDHAIQALSIHPVPPVLDMMPYLAVRSLSVDLKGRPLLNHLQHLFPALDGTLHLGLLDRRVREEIHADIRAANQRSQESDGDGLTRGWKKLDRIICDAAMLYVLGLRCPIRLVMIEPGVGHKYDRYLADALHENPVARLKLTLGHDLHELDRLFSPELAGTLTHLTLCLLYSNDYVSSPQGDEIKEDAVPQYRWDNVLVSHGSRDPCGYMCAFLITHRLTQEAIVSAIRPLHKLTHLRIVVGASMYVHKAAPWPFAPWQEYAHTFRPSRFDFEGAATTLARALPSV